MKNFHLSKKVGLSVFSAIMAAGITTSAIADDTEVFFPPQDGDLSLLNNGPNILFIMDTSGSMNTRDTDNGPRRIDIVKDALVKILSGLSQHTNVGLMRLSGTEGGPVLYPISPVDKRAVEVDAASPACMVTLPDDNEPVPKGPVFLRLGTGDAQNEAFEEEGSVTQLAQTSVDFGSVTRPGGVIADDFTVRVSAKSDDGYQKSGNEFDNNDKTVHLGHHLIGLHFPNVALQKDWEVTEAYLEFVQNDKNKQNERPDVALWADLTPDSPPISKKEYILDRPWTNNWTYWQARGNKSKNSTVRSNNIASVVNELRLQDGWASGNGMTFFAYGYQNDSFKVKMRDSSKNAAPRLVLKFNRPGGNKSVGTIAGLRFEDVRVPQGAPITSATLELVTANTATGDIDATVEIEASNDARPYESQQGDIADRRNYMSGKATFNQANSWGQTEQQKSVDVTALVQSVVDRGGWCGGNAMSFALTPTDNGDIRQAYSTLTTVPDDFEGDPAPRLRIEYDGSDPQAISGCSVREDVRQIGLAAYDGEEWLSNGDVSLNDQVLDLGREAGNNQIVSLYFQNLNVLRNAQIVDARIEFVSTQAAPDAASFEISAENVDDAVEVSESDYSISKRYASRTNARVTWEPASVDAAEEELVSENLAPVVQELVNRAGWRPGHEALFFIKGTGTRFVYSADQSPAKAPRLTIVYRGGVVDADATVPSETVRDRLIEITKTFGPGGSTPLVEVLTEAARHYRGEEVYFGRTRGSGYAYSSDEDGTWFYRTSHCSSYRGGAVDPEQCLRISPTDRACYKEKVVDKPDGTYSKATYIKPVHKSCQSNNIVMLTDGLPNQNNHANLVQKITGKACSGNACGPALAKYLAEEDQFPDIEGDQTISTYTVSFGAGSPGKSYVDEIAKAGGTVEAKSAEDVETLVTAFQEIVAEILDRNTTFVAPAVTINAFNRLTHLDQLYFALFKPNNEVRWSGNLKRFRLDGGQLSIVDLNGDKAVDDESGFFKDSSQSFWPVGNSPDGGEVTAGGAAKQLPDDPDTRNIYTNPGGGLSLSTFTNGNISAGQLGLDDSEQSKKEQVVNWARGWDVFDEDGNAATKARKAMGDPLHSEPVLLTRGGSEANPDISIFMGTNEGVLHAIDGATGKEQFAFVPGEFLPNLVTYMENSGDHNSRPYGVDGPLVIVENGEQKILVAGMRRGGEFMYALDVSNSRKTSPKILWKIDSQTSGFEELGQTWSRPAIGNVSVGGAKRKVLIFGGGYDPDQDSALGQREDSQGRALYIVDALTGKRIWSAGPAGETLQVAEMQASMPAPPRAVDLDADGLIDRVYIGDMNGKIFRFDFFKDNTGPSDMAKGYLYSSLGGPDEANNRRFYNEVDVALIEPKDQKPLLTLSVGSGFRAHPLDKDVRERFYVLKDYDARPVSEDKSSDEYRKPYFLKVQGIDDDLDGTADRQGIPGPVSANELVNVTDNGASAKGKAVYARGIFMGFNTGEKVLTVSRTFNNKVLFGTFQGGGAGGNECQAGEGISRLYVLDIFNLGPTENFSDPNNPDAPTDSLEDRYTELPHGGIPPNPVLLFPDSGGGLANEALVCVGPYCLSPNMAVTTQKTYWQEN